jgi:hypothetical protein
MAASMIVLIVMTVVVGILAAYRGFVAQHEDDFLHISDPNGQLATNQRHTARTLSSVDRIGIGLTIATAAYAIVLLVVFLYSGLH